MLTDQETLKVEFKITPEEMWTAVRGETQNWGIEGYEVPRLHYDYQQVKWHQKREEILKAHKREWPPKDWPKEKDSEKRVPPIRVNYIDEVVKLAKSFNDPVKSEEIKSNLEAKGHPIDKPKEAKPQINVRQKFLDYEKEQKEKKATLPQIPEWKTEGIQSVQTKMEEDEKAKKPYEQKVKEKYTKEKPLWPRCDRITILADAEFVGEQIPFYNTFKKEGDDPKSKKIFFPSKEFTWKKNPIWSIKKPSELPNEQMKARDGILGEKFEALKDKRNLKDDELMVDVYRSIRLTDARGCYPMKIFPPFNYQTDQYKLAREGKPEFSPGPDKYWTTLPYNGKRTQKQEDEQEKEGLSQEKKIYYCRRGKTDKRVYKPMRSSVF